MKRFIKNNKIFISIVLFLMLMNINLPYVIDITGGTINLNERIEVEGSNSNGTVNMAYVKQTRANIGLYLFSTINSKYDIYPFNFTEEEEEIDLMMGKVMLEESMDNAIILAYKKAGKTYSLNNRKVYITYILEGANTTLEVGDQVLEVDGIKVTGFEQLSEIIDSKDTFTFKVLNNGIEYSRKGSKIEYEGESVIGVVISETKDIVTDPVVTLSFEDNESGPSGGMMITLDIYNKLTEYDYLKGRNIAGTGTIDELGNVGAISGVKQKLNGTSADIFFIARGNLKEALEVRDKYNLDLEIVGVSTFDEVIEYLEKTK